MLVKKKDGTNNNCVDLRQLNLVTKNDAEAMGNSDDIISKQEDDKCFTRN